MRLLVTTIYTKTKSKFFYTQVLTVRTSKIVSLDSDTSERKILDAVSAAIDDAQPSPEHVLTSVTHCVV